APRSSLPKSAETRAPAATASRMAAWKVGRSSSGTSWRGRDWALDSRAMRAAMVPPRGGVAQGPDLPHLPDGGRGRDGVRGPVQEGQAAGEGTQGRRAGDAEQRPPEQRPREREPAHAAADPGGHVAA